MEEGAGSRRWLIILHLVLILCVWILPLMMIQELPDTVPVHFDAHGNPDSYATKTSFSLWILPVMATVLGMLVLILIRFPKLFNHPRRREVAKLPEHLRPQVYAILIEMMLVVFICMDILMFVIEYGALTSARTGHLSQSVPLILVIAFFPLALLIYYLPRIGKTVDRLKKIAATESASATAHQ